MTTIDQQSHLPQKFAQDLLDCQIQLQLNDKTSSIIIIKLIQLYRLGIEHYESIRSYKYLYFQRKMNSLVKSQKILNQLNQKKEEVVIQSLSDFKKQQIILNRQQGKQFSSKQNKSTHPFKRHIQQKIQQHFSIEQQKRFLQIKQKQKKEQEEKKIQQLEQKQKHKMLTTLINEKTIQLSSNKQIKKIITKFDQKFISFDQKINKNISDQQKQFMKKLQQRRNRVKSNTDKRRLTKSFSEHYGSTQGGQSNDLKHNNIEQTQLNILIDGNKINKRSIPSTRLFSSFIIQNKDDKMNNDEDEYADFVYEQVRNEKVQQKSEKKEEDIGLNLNIDIDININMNNNIKRQIA